MRVLVIGGTRFVGRTIVEELLRRGHQVTLFHRGKTNPSLFDSLEQILGDRSTDIALLGDRVWDAVIDTCGYDPNDVKLSVDHLVDRTGLYVFVSSIAVYEPTTSAGLDETAAVQSVPPTGEGVVWWHSDYARNKVECERLVASSFGAGRSLIVRPGMIVGPHDPVWYFTSWVARMLRGGDVLAPGDGSQPLQLIDVRDLAGFVGHLTSNLSAGVYTVTGPSPPLTMRSFLEEVAAATGTETKLVWVDESWLLQRDVHPTWDRIPYWLPQPEVEGYCRMSNARAIEAGLEITPIAEHSNGCAGLVQTGRLRITRRLDRRHPSLTRVDRRIRSGSARRVSGGEG